jgi:hypothetical protein
VETDNVIGFNCGTLVATGTTQGTAALIASDTVSVTSTGANQGIILPAGCYRVVVRNQNTAGGAAINVYPPSGAKIGGTTTNTPVNLAAQAGILLCEVTATQWTAAALS